MNGERTTIVKSDPKAVGDAVGVDWSKVPLEQFARGLEVELEHGARDAQTDVTHDDLIKTGKIALAHLKERPDYYSMLQKVESPSGQNVVMILGMPRRIKPTRMSLRMALPGEIANPGLGRIDPSPGMNFVYSGLHPDGHRMSGSHQVFIYNDDKINAFTNAISIGRPYAHYGPPGYDNPAHVIVADPIGRVTVHSFPSFRITRKMKGGITQHIATPPEPDEVSTIKKSAISNHRKYVEAGHDPNSFVNSHILLHKDMAPEFRSYLRSLASDDDHSERLFERLAQKVSGRADHQAAAIMDALFDDHRKGKRHHTDILDPGILFRFFENHGSSPTSKTKTSKMLRDIYYATRDRITKKFGYPIGSPGRAGIAGLTKKAYLAERLADKEDAQFEDDRHMIDEHGYPKTSLPPRMPLKMSLSPGTVMILGRPRRIKPTRMSLRMALPGEVRKPGIGHIDHRPSNKFVYASVDHVPRIAHDPIYHTDYPIETFLKAIAHGGTVSNHYVIPSDREGGVTHSVFVADPKGRVTHHEFHLQSEPSYVSESGRVVRSNPYDMADQLGDLAVRMHQHHVWRKTEPNSFLSSNVLLHKDMGKHFRDYVRDHYEENRHGPQNPLGLFEATGSGEGMRKLEALHEAAVKHAGEDAANAASLAMGDHFQGMWPGKVANNIAYWGFENVGDLQAFGKTKSSDALLKRAASDIDLAWNNKEIGSQQQANIGKQSDLRRRLAEEQDSQFEDDRHTIDEYGAPVVRGKSLREELAERTKKATAKKKPDWQVSMDIANPDGEDFGEDDHGQGR